MASSVSGTSGILVAALALAACNRAPTAPAAQPQSATSQTTVAELAEPPDPGFIGRVWVSTRPGSPRGSMLVFLPDRSLLMDSCWETYRISKWGVAGERIRWLEDTIPIEADVQMRGKDQLVLQIAGRDEAETFVAANVPFVCPDMPR